MSLELQAEFESLMNTIDLGMSENEIQRRLGMLYLKYRQEVDDGKYESVL